MPTTDPIVITPSTSVVLVNTADFSGNPIVLLPNIDSIGRVITIRDADGGSLTKPIYISTTGGAQFQQEISTVTISSLVITQPYGFYTITPRTVGPSGTRYGIMNAFAFRESSDYAYVNMFNTNMGYVSTLSTINLEVNQDINVLGNINVTGSINYTNPGSVTFNADVVNTRDIGVSTIKSATIYTSTAYASSIYLANTLEASTMRLTSRPVFDLSGSSTWSNYMSGGTDPNSMTLGNPSAGAGAQIGTGTEFFGIRSFSKAGINNFSTSILARYGNVGINYPYTDITYNGGQPNYTLSVNGALRLSNSDTRPQQSNIIFKANGQAGSSNRYINTFGATDTNYTLYSANNETHGFYDSGSQYQWITADKGASYPETIKFWTGNNEERMRIDSAGNVGVGTGSLAPAYRLDVSGAIRTNTAVVLPDGLVAAPALNFGSGSGSDANTGLYHPVDNTIGLVADGVETVRVDGSGVQLVDGSAVKPAVNFGLGVVADPGTGIYHPGTGQVAVATGGVRRMVVEADGTVGITKSSGVALDVSGGIRTGGIITVGDGLVGAPAFNFGLDDDTGIYRPGTNQMAFVTAGTSRMIIDADGKVNISKSSGIALDVSGQIRASSFDVSGQIGTNTAISLPNGSLAAPALNFGNSSTPDANTGIYHPADNTLGLVTDGVEVARVDGSGVQLRDGSASKPALNFGLGGTTDPDTGIYHPGDGIIAFSTNGTEKVRINSSGQVGINSSGPGTYLDIYGTSAFGTGRITQYATATQNALPSIRLQNANDTSHRLEFFTNLAGGSYNNIVQANDKAIIFTNGSVGTGNFVIAPEATGPSGLRINSSGQVGIGKSPSVALDVAGQIQTNNSIVLPDGSVGGPAIRFTDDTTTGIYSRANGEVNIAITGAEAIRIDSAGIQFKDGSVAKPSINFGLGTGTDSNTGIYHPIDNTLGFVTEGTERVRIDATGLVGITKTSGVALDVSGQIRTAASIVLPNGSAATPAINFGNGSGTDTDTGIYHPADGIIGFATNGNERMRIDTAGQVGIGKTPSYALDVSGDIQVTGQSAGGVYVRNSVSDSRVWLYPKNGTNPTEIKRYDGTNGNIDIINYGTGQINLTANSSSYNGISILNNGRVGVGTTSPSGVLDVQNNDPNLWVAVGSGTNSIAYSSNGSTWTGIGTSIFSSSGSRVAYNGSMWVAVGSGTNTIAYSLNGTSWTGLGTSIFTTRGYGIAWNGSIWVAVGEGGNSIAYSSDGISWSAATNAFSARGRNVAWNGSIWVAVGEGTNTIAYSTNGTSWTGAGAVFSTAGYSVAWDGYKWLAGGEDSTYSIYASENGINWVGVQNTKAALFTAYVHGIAWNGSMWVAVGSSTIPFLRLAYSYDGYVWDGVVISNVTNGYTVSWNGSSWIAGFIGTNKMYSSSDGITWSNVSGQPFSTVCNDIANSVGKIPNMKLNNTNIYAQGVPNFNSTNPQLSVYSNKFTFNKYIDSPSLVIGGISIANDDGLKIPLIIGTGALYRPGNQVNQSTGTTGSVWTYNSYNTWWVRVDTWNYVIIFPGFRLKIWNSPTVNGTMISNTANFDIRNTTNYPVIYNLSDYGGGDQNDMYEISRI